ncbi:response regulator transcription factor [Bradyrhizobium genosp. L]|uniref:helix-turn-helix transcriptional regulator n=1 Tax=Bradyrhizobium genosp. L TaxID=83637 RepID=UPI0018A2745A|nr:LuxR C-terminal-related transcriptional regulator [Bradyrhizobium genosp. L]QPF84693.1 response regulator transcription factor [Bradyrhizobium genosp. L]
MVGKSGRQSRGAGGALHQQTAATGAAADPPGLDLKAWINALSAVPAGAITEHQILAWVEGPLRIFFPFERFLGSYGKLSGGRIRMRNLVTSGHHAEFIATLDRAFDISSRGVFAWWVQNRAAFILDPASPPPFATKRELDEIKQFSLGIIAAHGVVDPFANTGTYVSFAGVAADDPVRTRAALNLIAPVLHALFLATEQVAASSVDLSKLTDRQRQLVDLALLGLPDKTIASRLGISENTVGNHFRGIYQRLGISKRSQLIAALKS